jgi:hypothetical protein
MVAPGDVRRLVVFRFDRDPLVCRSQVGVLRQLNPGTPVHGLYGGPLGARGRAFGWVGGPVLGLDSVFVSPHQAGWNWKNGDLSLLDWFRERGRWLPFDVLHLLEWDLLMLEPLAAAYASVPPDAVGLTALTPIEELPSDWRWTAGPIERREHEALLRHVHARWPGNYVPRACIGAGPCLPRAFLEAYAAADPPEWGNDELRLPLYSEALGFRVVDTGLVPDRTALATDRFFNVGGPSVDPADVFAALHEPTGPRVFHPVRTRLPALRRQLRRSRGGQATRA